MDEPRHLVIFDDGCRFCSRSVRLMQRLDWLRQFEWLGQRALRNRASALEVSQAELKQAVHVITGEGGTLKAARALRFIALRLPLAAPAAALLFLPGVLPGAERLYRWLSCHRHRLIPQCDSTTGDSSRL